MKIDKKILNRCIWYEDIEGNVIDVPEGIVSPDIDVEHCTYHVLFPLEITEHIYSYDGKTHETHHILDANTHIGGGSQDVIMAMVNSGDYTLSEALVLWSQSCERCMNVLSYKYLDGKDGYPEYSDEWKRCGTTCKFCEHEK